MTCDILPPHPFTRIQEIFMFLEKKTNYFLTLLSRHVISREKRKTLSFIVIISTEYMTFVNKARKFKVSDHVRLDLKTLFASFTATGCRKRFN